MIGFLVIAAALLKRAGSDGVGKIRRNIYAEIEALQKAGVDFSLTYQQQNFSQDSTLEYYMRQFRWQPSSRSDKRPAEQYYNNLRNAYRKLAGAIGRPHTTHTIHNSNGDVILQYNHYDPELDLKNAKGLISELAESDAQAYNRGYYTAVLWIANGGKFLWKDKGTKKGIESSLFGKQAPEERKRYGWIVSTSGRSVDEMAEAAAGYNGDSLEALAGVLDAIRAYSSRKEANDAIRQAYYDSEQTDTDYYAGREEWERNQYLEEAREATRQMDEEFWASHRSDNPVLPF